MKRMRIKNYVVLKIKHVHTTHLIEIVPINQSQLIILVYSLYTSISFTKINLTFELKDIQYRSELETDYFN